MGYDQYAAPDRSCRILYCCFPLPFANIRLWPLMPFFQISLNNSELKTTHNLPSWIVACTFPNNLSRNSCMSILLSCPQKLRFSPGNLF